MNELWRYYAKWNKAVTKNTNNVWCHLHEVLVSDSQTESRTVLSKGQGERRMTCSMGTEFQFYKMREFWRLTAQ